VFRPDDTACLPTPGTIRPGTLPVGTRVVPFREQVTATDYNRKLPRDSERVRAVVEAALRLRSSDTQTKSRKLVSSEGFNRVDGSRLTASDG